MSQTLGKLLTVAVFLAMCSAAPIEAQTCDDFDECTNLDMCADGVCTGTPISDATCDDGNACTTNDTCATGVCSGTPLDEGACDDGSECTINDTCVSGTCQGTPVASGTACGDSCGMCMSGTCVPDPARQEQPCTDDVGACTTNDICLGSICLGTFVVCPDSDDNACTGEVCNPATGQCQNIGPIPCGDCGACDPETGDCAAVNEGAACDDSNVCTGDGTCTDGVCVSGVPGGTATATFTPTDEGAATPTATGMPTGTGSATVTATATESGIETPTFTPTLPVISTPTGTPTGTAEATATATGTPTGTAAATATATGTPTGTAAATATATNTVGGPTATATVQAATSTATVTRTATATNTPLPIDATIIVGSAAGEAGGTAMVEVSLETTVEVAGTQNDIAFDPMARIAADEEGNPKCTVNPAINKPGTTFAFQPVDCTPGTDCTGVRALVLALDNVTPIPSGSVLYTCEIEIAVDATGTFPLTCSSPGAGDPDGNRVGADCTNGTITVAIATDATIVIGDAVGAAGDFVPVQVSLQTAVEVAGTQNDINFPPEAAVAAGEDGLPLCAVNPAINKPQSTFAFQPPGCTPGTDCTGVRALVLAFANVAAIPNGATLYTCQIAIASDAPDGTYPLTCSAAGASDSDGGAVPTSCLNGEVVVGVQPTETATLTPTATETPTPTPTGGEGTATVTPTPLPPTATSTVTRTATNTRRPSSEDDGCQVVGTSAGGSAWMLIIPAALLLRLRRRRR